MPDPIDRLCALLDPFQRGEVAHIPTHPCSDPGWQGKHILEHTHPQVEAIEALASDLLIGDDSRPKWVVMKEIERLLGVRFGPGEQDSFGWLTGAIHTRAGVIIYG